MAYQNTPDEFLQMIDLYIQAKVTKAEEIASQFTSQNDVSIELKKSYTSFIIPCMIGARNDIKEVLKESEVNNHNAGEAFGILIYYITRRSMRMGDLKENCTDPIILAGLNLVQGVSVDLISEISALAQTTLGLSAESIEATFALVRGMLNS
ncbi:hypothetical protein [Nostoc sp.]|uniref:hypothetical protein n=1 Tax=Nostoc sp. TaxID=1180 RepID=UPI0035937E5C